MAKLFAAACALAFGLLLPAQSFAKSHAMDATVAVGTAHKGGTAPDAREFLSPFSTVYASVKFHDDGTTMTVNGAASIPACPIRRFSTTRVPCRKERWHAFRPLRIISPQRR
jgi:hypothetical protein